MLSWFPWIENKQVIFKKKQKEHKANRGFTTYSYICIFMWAPNYEEYLMFIAKSSPVYAVLKR